MATNPVIYVMQYVLALGFIIHIVMGIKLTIQNKIARSKNYAYNQMSKNTDFSSRSMIISGVLIILFLILHLRDYFYQMKFVGLPEGTTDYDLVVTLFSNPIYTVVYVFAFIVLGIHLISLVIFNIFANDILGSSFLNLIFPYKGFPPL